MEFKSQLEEFISRLKEARSAYKQVLSGFAKIERTAVSYAEVVLYCRGLGVFDDSILKSYNENKETWFGKRRIAFREALNVLFQKTA